MRLAPAAPSQATRSGASGSSKKIASTAELSTIISAGRASRRRDRRYRRSDAVSCLPGRGPGLRSVAGHRRAACPPAPAPPPLRRARPASRAAPASTASVRLSPVRAAISRASACASGFLMFMPMRFLPLYHVKVYRIISGGNRCGNHARHGAIRQDFRPRACIHLPCRAVNAGSDIQSYQRLVRSRTRAAAACGSLPSPERRGDPVEGRGLGGRDLLAAEAEEAALGSGLGDLGGDRLQPVAEARRRRRRLRRDEAATAASSPIAASTTSAGFLPRAWLFSAARAMSRPSAVS